MAATIGSLLGLRRRVVSARRLTNQSLASDGPAKEAAPVAIRSVRIEGATTNDPLKPQYRSLKSTHGVVRTPWNSHESCKTPAMSCPRCGGTSRRSISPGFWECTTVLSQLAPGPGRDHPALGPAVVEQQFPCGHRYQDGEQVGAEPCSSGCGRYAIGHCVDCGSPVCGMCSPHDGDLLCVEDRRQREAPARAAREKAEREQVRYNERVRAQIERSKARSENREIMAEDYLASMSLLSEALPRLRAHAAARAVPLRSGRRVRAQGWRITDFSSDNGGNLWDPSASRSLFLTTDGVLVAATQSGDQWKLPKKVNKVEVSSPEQAKIAALISSGRPRDADRLWSRYGLDTALEFAASEPGRVLAGVNKHLPAEQQFEPRQPWW